MYNPNKMEPVEAAVFLVLIHSRHQKFESDFIPNITKGKFIFYELRFHGKDLKKDTSKSIKMPLETHTV